MRGTLSDDDVNAIDQRVPDTLVELKLEQH
jgi:hypothetical protein